MKRNYLFYWFAVLLLLFTSARSYAEVYSGSCGESVNWSLDTETGLLEITGSGEMYDYDDIPWYSHRSSINKCSIKNGVTSIGDYAFEGCTGLTSINIPESVTTIGDAAFNSCSGLTSITIPDSVKSIGEGAFNWCTGLTNITWNAISCSIDLYHKIFHGSTNNITSFTFGDKVQIIPNNICYEMNNLTNITIPNSVISIGDYAFWGCTRLRSITIPEGVTSIGNYAFANCIKITSLYIPSSVKRIGNGITYKCISLLQINVDTDNKVFKSIEGVLFTHNEKYLISFPAGKTGDYTISKNVTSINDCAFRSCFFLSNINVDTDNKVFKSIEGVLFTYDKRYLISFPAGKVEKKYTVPYTVSKISNYAFSDCTNLKNLNFYSSIMEFATGAFYGCTGLTSITIPEFVTSIGEYAFSGCTGLTSIIISENVTSIGDYAFLNCTNLKTVINYSKLNIKGSYYHDFTNYGGIGIFADNIFDAEDQIGDYFFVKSNNKYYLKYYIGNKKELYLPNDYRSCKYNIGTNVFKDHVELSNITIPESVTDIGNGAFSGCTGLTNITIPESVTSIGDSTFYGCNGLTNISIPESVINIGNGAFFDCI